MHLGAFLLFSTENREKERMVEYHSTNFIVTEHNRFLRFLRKNDKIVYALVRSAPERISIYAPFIKKRFCGAWVFKRKGEFYEY